MVCDNELIGKTIIKAEVGGYGIKLWLDDDMIFDFKASDGGYSCWELYPRSKMEEQEYNPCQNCSDYDGASGCYANGVRLPASWAKYQVWKEPYGEEQK